VFELIQGKEHLTLEGVKKILSIKAVFNNGLGDDLMASLRLPDIVPAIRPLVPSSIILHPN